MCNDSWMAKKSEEFKVFTCSVSSKAVSLEVDRILKRMQCTQKSKDISYSMKCSCQVIPHFLLEYQPAQIQRLRFENTAFRVCREVVWGCCLCLVKHPKYTKWGRQWFLCYYDHVSRASEVSADSLSWNSWSLVSFHASAACLLLYFLTHSRQPVESLYLRYSCWRKITARQVTTCKYIYIRYLFWSMLVLNQAFSYKCSYESSFLRIVFWSDYRICAK